MDGFASDSKTIFEKGLKKLVFFLIETRFDRLISNSIINVLLQLLIRTLKRKMKLSILIQKQETSSF